MTLAVDVKYLSFIRAKKWRISTKLLKYDSQERRVSRKQDLLKYQFKHNNKSVQIVVLLFPLFFLPSASTLQYLQYNFFLIGQ